MNAPFSLFSVYGIEIEYMIVDKTTLNVRPIADEILRDEHDEIVDELANGPVSWCNELARHVIELKCTQPAETLVGLADAFQTNVQAVNARLAPLDACLMPGGMHPWMMPERDMQLWPYGQKDIYRQFDRIFSCQGHGWSNLQSMQINLPFANDAEFAALHAAIRIMLPLIAGIAASTPFAEGLDSGWHSHRLQVYRHNARRVPEVTGAVVPEPSTSIADYHARILQPMYHAIAPLDPNGLLQEEWLNARGAIARFDRMAIEIRTIDSQECPLADLAIAELISELVRWLCERFNAEEQHLNAFDTRALGRLLMDIAQHGEDSQIADRRYLSLFGLNTGQSSVASVWDSITEILVAGGRLQPATQLHVERILRHGTLSTRLRRMLGNHAASTQSLAPVAQRLCEALRENSPIE